MERGSGLSGLRISRTSAADQVADALAAAILDGELLPDTPLREVELAQTLSVSRNTVREGIRALVNRGLATHHMHRGAAVVRLDERDVTDIYRARKVLEVSALRAEPAGREQLERFAAAAEGFDRAASSTAPAGTVPQDLEFHASVVALAGSPRLDRFFENIQTEMRLCLSVISQIDREHLRSEEVAAEHLAIFRAHADGRREEASRMMLAHLDENEERLKEILGRLEDVGRNPGDQ